MAFKVSPALPLLVSDETPLLSGPLTNEQTSWIGSITFIGVLAGAFSFGYITASLGPKRAVSSVAIPIISFWLLIHFGSTYYHVLIARLISGFAAGGCQSVIILFISEIANDKYAFTN